MFPTAHGIVSQGGQGGEAPPGGFRFYRLRFLSNNGRNTLNVAEVELRAVPGGPNAATGGAASASSVFVSSSAGSFPASRAFDSDPATYWSSLPIDGQIGGAEQPGAGASSEFAGFPASNAFDGDPSTFWSSASGVTAASIRYDYGLDVTGPDVTKYRVRARADAADGAPKDWTLMYSDDGSTWTTAHTVTSQTGWAPGETREYTLASVGAHRAWRLNITANNGRSTINIAEIQFDGCSWGSITLTYDKGAGSTIQVAEYTIQARADAANGAPRDWVLEASNDGITWEEVHAVSGETGWANGEQRVFTL